MKKIKRKFICQTCAHSTAKWIGKCPSCSQWNSFIEKEVQADGQAKKIDKAKNAKKLSAVKQENILRIQAQVEEFDRVVGGGLVLGSLNLIAGEPGIGKSTLVLELCRKFCKLYKDKMVLYVSGEESDYQIAQRAKRLEIDENNLLLLNETSWQAIKVEISKVLPFVLIIDSIQTTISDEIQSAPGSVSQLKEVTYELMNYAKSKHLTTLVIGHVTKEGQIAGPKVLEHMVDSVIYFEGEQSNQYRMLRAIKNRFGNTNEVGLFEMKKNGLKEVLNPSEYFLGECLKDVYGSSITCILEGNRSLFVETQALVIENKYGNGRRTTQGIDNNRLAMLIAVLEKHYGLPLGFSDIYLNVTGGIKLSAREADLSVVASILSSFYKIPLQRRYIFVGEVGLTGEVRAIPFFESRIKEIEKLNYKKIFTSAKNSSEFSKLSNIEIIGIHEVSELKKYLFN